MIGDILKLQGPGFFRFFSHHFIQWWFVLPLISYEIGRKTVAKFIYGKYISKCQDTTLEGRNKGHSCVCSFLGKKYISRKTQHWLIASGLKHRIIWVSHWRFCLLSRCVHESVTPLIFIEFLSCVCHGSWCWVGAANETDKSSNLQRLFSLIKNKNKKTNRSQVT